MIEHVGVLGAGQMGAGIAEVCARAGCTVAVREVDDQRLAAGRERIERSLARAESKGRLDDAAAVTQRLAYGTDLDVVAGCGLVVEAVVEDEQTKRAVFGELDRVVVDDSAILASNTSSIPIARLGAATGRPGSVVGMHFFNPVPVMDLVELIPSLATTGDTTDRAARFVSEQLGKRVVHCTDRAGFVVNALLIPYLLDAIRLVEAGVASAEDVDAGMVAGCNHPMGPLALADFIGLDTTLAVAESLHAEFREPRYAPPPLLSRLVDAGRLGRKSGAGIYDY